MADTQTPETIYRDRIIYSIHSPSVRSDTTPSSVSVYCIVQVCVCERVCVVEEKSEKSLSMKGYRATVWVRGEEDGKGRGRRYCRDED